MSARLLAQGLLGGPLDHQPLPSDEVEDGAPTTAVHALAELGEVEVGIWEMTRGAARDTEVDEVFVVLAGAGRVEFEDGEVLDLRAGTAVRLAAGERTRWTVTETLRKVYVAG